MADLFDLLKNDSEIQELKEKCHEITGKWIPIHYDCFGTIEEYKEYMRNIIKEYEKGDNM